MRIINYLRKRPLVRRLGVPAYRTFSRYYPFCYGPKICIISIPKAGTHLISAVLNKIPGLIFSGYHLSEEKIFESYPSIPNQTPVSPLLSQTISSCRDGQYLTLHSPFDDRVNREINAQGMKKIFVVRDPRDILVSYVNYVLRESRHFHHRYFNRIADFDQILEQCIVGFKANDDAPLGLPSVVELIDNYSGWINDPATQVVSFEKLVGAKGGGSFEDQLSEIRLIVSAIGIELKEDELLELSGKVYSENSITFTRGSINQWSSSFSRGNSDLFMELASTEIEKMGYLNLERQS